MVEFRHQDHHPRKVRLGAKRPFHVEFFRQFGKTRPPGVDIGFGPSRIDLDAHEELVGFDFVELARIAMLNPASKIWPATRATMPGGSDRQGAGGRLRRPVQNKRRKRRAFWKSWLGGHVEPSQRPASRRVFPLCRIKGVKSRGT